MARSQEDSTTALLKLKYGKVRKVPEGEETVIVKVEINEESRCPFYGSASYAGMGYVR